MNEYCNGCGVEDTPLKEMPNGHSLCDDCRYSDYWAAAS